MASMSKVTNAERLQMVEVGSVQNTSEMIEPGSHVEVRTLLEMGTVTHS
jgi:hypothetical protein